MSSRRRRNSEAERGEVLNYLFGGGSSDRTLDASVTSNFSNTGNAQADEVSNRNGGDYHQSDARRETEATNRQASQAWHDARDDEQAGQGWFDRHDGGWPL
jgi:hypothetical protein